jgi:diguanylate cyclase
MLSIIAPASHGKCREIIGADNTATMPAQNMSMLEFDTQFTSSPAMQNPLPRESFPAGHLIFLCGDPGDCAYVIESGAVEILSGSGEKIATLLAGELFGEVALLDALPRTASIRTLEPTTLLRIDRPHIQELLKRTDPVIRYLLTLLLVRFRFRSGASQNTSPKRQPPESSDEMVATRTLMLAQDLAYAVDNGQLELAYQPLVGFADQEIVGFEALIRWNHPLLGTIMPSNLIGLAEKTGLIHQVGQWVLKQAFADWPQLRQSTLDSGNPRPFLSVNLSAAELIKPNIVETIGHLMEHADIQPPELKIELTETLIIEDIELVGSILGKLGAMGITIALDDFGTGYAGLEHLDKLPISCLKIDRSFIQKTGLQPRTTEIVNIAINLARTLGMTTIVEGVETASAAKQLREMGCDIAQGYFFAHPMPLDAVLAWIAQPPFRSDWRD